MSQNLYIVQGATFIQPFRWGVEPILYLPITEIVGLAPLQMTVTDHGIPEKWKVEAVSFKGLIEINSTGKDKPTDYHYPIIVDKDTVEFNEVNATDMGEYLSGGLLKFYTPKDLTGHTAELTIWTKVNGDVLRRFTSDPSDGLTIDISECSITLSMDVDETTALTWKKGVFSLKATETATGVVTEIAQGPVTVELE